MKKVSKTFITALTVMSLILHFYLPLVPKFARADDPPQQGSLYIKKNVIPHYEWNEGPAWNFNILGTELDAGGWTLKDQQWGGIDLPPGTYGVSESPSSGVEPNDFYEASYRCVDSPNFRDQSNTGEVIASGTGTIVQDLQLQAGHTIYCTFTNTYVANTNCGDGVLQTDMGEECDDGNNQDGDGCSSICQIETCNLFFSEYNI